MVGELSQILWMLLFKETGKLSLDLVSDNARDDLCFIGQTT